MLRFAPDLEDQFAQDYERSSYPFRYALCLMAITMIGITPLYDGGMMNVPAAFNAIARPIQFWLEIPAVFIALLITRIPRLRSASPLAMVVGSLILAGGLIAQRVIGAQYDFDVPSSFAIMTICGALLISRLRFWTYFPWALLAFSASTVAELWTFYGQASAIYQVSANAMLMTIGFAGAYSAEHSVRSSWLRERMLALRSSVDSLTGVANRREFDRLMARTLRQAQRENQPVTLLLMDLDHFKQFNDEHGHLAGDDALRRVGAYLQQLPRRPLDLVARYGGEEFAIVWYGASRTEIVALAESACSGVEALDIRASKMDSALTASGGLAHAFSNQNITTREFVRLADKALYKAKKAGRNQVIIHQKRAG